MALARKEAQRLNHDFIGTEHILLGLIGEGSGVAANVLKNLGVRIEEIRREIEENVQSGPSMVTAGQLPFTPRAKKVLELAMEEADDLGHNYIGTEHLLLGLIRERQGVAATVLQDLQLKLEDVRAEILELLCAAGVGKAGRSVVPLSVVEERGLDVVDERGRARIEIDVRAGERFFLRLRGEVGFELVSLRVADDGSIRLVQRDAEGRILFEWPPRDPSAGPKE